MRLIGRFALGGFAVVAVGFCAAFTIAGCWNGFASLDFLWLVFDVVVGGFLGAVGGTVLALAGLLLERLFPRPAAPAAPTPADDGTVWPPPPDPANPGT